MNNSVLNTLIGEFSKRNESYRNWLDLPTTTQQTKKWKTFACHSPLIRKITNLFKHTNLNTAVRATNTIHQQLTDEIVKTSTNSSGIYRLKCNTCNK